MSTQQLLLVAATALLVFWMLGAHNRLVALRNDIGAAWAQVDEPMQQRAAAVTPLVSGLRLHLPDEHGTLDAVLAALAQVQAASDGLRPRPAAATRASALGSAESTLSAALARLLALLEHRPELNADASLAAYMVSLRDATQRLAFARQLFNNAVGVYNEAADQFPTRVLARLFGFGAAGRL